MSQLVITDGKVYLGQYNLSAQHSSTGMTYEAEMLDNTAMGTSGTRSNLPGLKVFTLSGDLFWDDTSDLALFSRIGGVALTMSIAPVGNAEGDLAYTVKAVSGNYNPVSGEVGALLKSTMEARAAGTPLVRGNVLAVGAKTVTGTGTGAEYGAVSATQRVYSALHVTAIAGTDTPTFTGTVESDAAGTFLSPTTVLTHAAMIAVGSDWQEDDSGGGITDTFWRASWVISGTNPSFTVFWVFGIL